MKRACMATCWVNPFGIQTRRSRTDTAEAMMKKPLILSGLTLFAALIYGTAALGEVG